MAPTYRDYLLAQGLLKAAQAQQQRPVPQAPIPPTFTPQQAVSLIPRVAFDQNGAPNPQPRPVAPAPSPVQASPTVPPAPTPQQAAMPPIDPRAFSPAGAGGPPISDPRSPLFQHYQAALAIGYTPQQATEYAIGLAEKGDPIARATESAVGTAVDAGGSVAGAVADSPPGQAAGYVLGQYERPFRAVAKNTGEAMYTKAMTGEGPMIWDEWSSAYFYKDATIEQWAGDPANKEKIKVLYEQGLDLNEDGVVDVKGGDAVWLVWNNETHPGFIDRLISDMGFDPLFALSMVAPAAGAGRVGAQTAEEAAILAGMPRTARVARAVDRALSGVTKAGEAGNAVADAPFTLTVGAARQAARAGNRLPGFVRHGMEWLSAPAPGTVEQRAANEAIDAADVALAAPAVPSYGSVAPEPPLPVPDTAPALPASTAPEPSAAPVIREPSPAREPIPVASGEIPATVERRTVAGKPRWLIGDEGQVRVRTVSGKGYILEQKQPNGKFSAVGDPYSDADLAVTAGKDLVGPTTMAPDPASVVSGPVAIPETPAIPPERRLPTDGMTRAERNAAIKDGRISSLTPVRDGPRLIDQAWTRGDVDPQGWQTFAADYTPKAEAYKARVAAVEQKFYPDFGHKIADQTIGGIEHTVDDVAPSFQRSFGDLPDIAPTSQRKTLPTKSGKASYRDENLPYLYERYVYTESDKDAARIMETLRKRPELFNAPWSEDALERLTQARERLKDLRGSDELGRGGLIAAGIVSPEARMLNDLMNRVDEVTTRALGPSRAAPDVPRSPDFALDDMGARERFLAGSEIETQAIRGAIPQETAAVLARPVRDIRIKKGGKWVDGTPDDLAGYNAKHPDAAIGETGGFKDAAIQVDEITHLDLLQRVAQQMPDATAGEISQAFSDRVLDLTGARVPPRVRLAPVVEQVRGGLAATSNIAREVALYNPVTGGRGILGDFGSDTLRMAMDGHVAAALKNLTGVDYVRRLAGGEAEAVRVSRQFGEDLPADLRVLKGRTEVTAEGRTSLHKAVSRRVGVKEGSKADRAIGIATGTLDSRWMRDARNAADNVRRESVFVSEIEKREFAALREFKQRGRTWAERHGILPSSFDAYLFDLGQRFGAEDVRRVMRELADDAGLPADRAVNFSDRMARDWKASTRKLFKAADAEQKRVLLSYERTNLDNFLGNFIFYHYWMSRAIPAYTRIALRNPELAAMWIRTWTDVQDRAEKAGYPDSLKGYIRFMGSAAGWNYAMNPLNLILPIADMTPDAQAEGWFETLTQFVALNPIVGWGAAAMGLTNDVIDPLMTYPVRNMVMSAVNEVRVRTGRDPYLNDPFEQLLRNGTEFANDVLTKLNVPLAKEQLYADPATFTQSEINYTVADVIAESTGVPTDEWVVGGPEYERYVQAIKDGQAGVENPDYQEGVKRWADADLTGRGLNSLIPGGVRTRYGPRDAQMGQELTDQGYTFKGVVNAGSAESAELTLLDEEYQGIGTERQQSLADGWTAIVHGPKGPVEGMLFVGGQWFSAEAVQAMDEDDRKDLADAWVAEHEGTEELKAYYDERSAFIEKHPEYGGYDEWKDMGYGYEGGLRAFRTDRASGNPNFKQAMADQRDYLLNERGTDPKLVDDELDRWAVSVAGYKAAQGIKDSVYDPDPISTGDQGTVNTILRSDGGSGGGGFGSSAPKSTAKKLREDMADFRKETAKFDELLAGVGVTGGFASINNPLMMSGLKKQFGDLMPEPSSLLRKYWEWVEMVTKYDPNADTSPEAFERVLDGLKREQVAA